MRMVAKTTGRGCVYKDDLERKYRALRAEVNAAIKENDKLRARIAELTGKAPDDDALMFDEEEGYSDGE